MCPHTPKIIRKQACDQTFLDPFLLIFVEVLIPDCTEHQLPCHNGQCIEIRQFCDGNYDCYDKSDEPWGCRK